MLNVLLCFFVEYKSVYFSYFVSSLTGSGFDAWVLDYTKNNTIILKYICFEKDFEKLKWHRHNMLHFSF